MNKHMSFDLYWTLKMLLPTLIRELLTLPKRLDNCEFWKKERETDRQTYFIYIT